MNNVETLAEKWREACKQADLAKQALIDAVEAQNQAGTSEYKLTSQAGVTRATIRSWLKK